MKATHHHDHQEDGHFWSTRSSHSTSEGVVTYQACPCGRWRILGAARVAEIARSPY
jgi:hypothetical protein